MRDKSETRHFLNALGSRIAQMLFKTLSQRHNQFVGPTIYLFIKQIFPASLLHEFVVCLMWRELER